MGFFGKGTLSRSEPSWLDREKAQVRREMYGVGDGRAAEDATRARREERRLFKLERARVERERIEKQRLAEEGKLGSDQLDPKVDDDPESRLVGFSHSTSETTIDAQSEMDNASTYVANGSIEVSKKNESVSLETANGNLDAKAVKQGRVPDVDVLKATDSQMKIVKAQAEAVQQRRQTDDVLANDNEPEPDIYDQEHLQLTLEEALFLTYGLGVLRIFPSTTLESSRAPKSSPKPYSTREMLELFSQHSTFPPLPPDTELAPDDQFLLNYVTYHHFRSLGWVVRPGVKFAVDYLLYNRGPAFSHAEFAVLIIPSYSHRDWNSPGGRSRRRVEEQKDWWWLHCINRVQSQVKKTLILCYVDIPSPFELELELQEYEEETAFVDIGWLLKSYKIREFVVRRWLANRSRD